MRKIFLITLFIYSSIYAQESILSNILDSEIKSSGDKVKEVVTTEIEEISVIDHTRPLEPVEITTVEPDPIVIEEVEPEPALVEEVEPDPVVIEEVAQESPVIDDTLVEEELIAEEPPESIDDILISFIKDYYRDLNSKQIKEASLKLSRRFLISYGGYREYETFWLNVSSVGIDNIEVVSIEDSKGILRGRVTYNFDGVEISKVMNKITLIKTEDSWEIR